MQKSQYFHELRVKPSSILPPLANSLTSGCRLWGVKFPSLKTAMTILACLIFTPALNASAPESTDWHPLADIQSTASAFVRDRAHKPGTTTTVTAAELDYRLKLHRCGVALEAYLSPGARLSANTTVGVKCTSPRPWKLFVPVRVGVAANILVAARPLPAGTALTSDDLIVMERDLGTVHGGYLREGESIVGMVLKRRLAEGEPLRNELLKAPNVVRRGQQVTIRSGSKEGPFNIRMSGTALSDGRIGQRIRVKNRSSGRTIEGVIQSSEVIQIGH